MKILCFDHLLFILYQVRSRDSDRSVVNLSCHASLPGLCDMIPIRIEVEQHSTKFAEQASH